MDDRHPGRGNAFPRVDDHLVAPEVTRDEIIKGRRVVALPAEAPHGDQHHRLDYVTAAHVAPGYEGSTDLITRVGPKSDFASDACIRKAGIDPATGSRYLEEIAFEVVSTQSEKDAADKAEEMLARGVRRVFGIFVKEPRRVCEWSPQSRSWQPLDAGFRIEDRCLAAPLPVAGLLDSALAHQAVVEALVARNEPTIGRLTAAAMAEGEARGEAKGKAESVLDLLENRGLTVSPEQRAEILGCSDLARLKQWLLSAGSVATATVGELLTAPPEPRATLTR
ncbi:MAG TPA: hypothetical protein DD490_12265 [Acidobacteria bacterium]|nr:hypothetical protein [Acidobacteriota bacterium]